MGEDLDQLLAVLEELHWRHLGPGLAQERLLAGGTNDVVVGVAVARERERVKPAERLVAGLQVDLRVVLGRAGVGSVLVVVAVVDVDVDAADRVDGPGETGEVDVDQMVDRRGPVSCLTVCSVSFGPPASRRR